MRSRLSSSPRRVFLLLFPLFALAVSQAGAEQPAPPAGLLGTGLEALPRERPPLPDFRPETKPDIGLPPLEPAPQAPLSSQARILVTRIEVTGNTVFSRSELAEVIAPFEGREITAEELQSLRRQLTLFYVDQGYVNSGAVIPDQEVSDGVVTIRIVEGSLTGIEISGLRRLREGYVRDRLQRGLAGALDMDDLGRNVLSMHDGPVVKRIKARLRPGAKPGEGILHAEVEEKGPWDLRFQVANDRSPSVGGERLQTYLAHHNLTGWADTLDLKGSLTEGVGDGEISYSRPLFADDTMVRAWYSKCNSEVVESPFDALDISSKTETYGIALDHPFGREDGRSWSIGPTLEHRRGETFLLGEPFFFSPGAVDGVVEITAFRLSQGFLLRRPSRVVACRQMLSLGINGLGTAVSDPGPEKNFIAWLGQAQWAERLGDHEIQLITRVDLQLAHEPLLYLEKFAVGGATKVRGYRENLLVRDNGILASVELRVPVGRVPLFGLSREVEDGAVQLAPFIDWGRSWNSETPRSEEKEVASLGVGLRWDPSPKLHAQIYFAYPLNDDGIDQATHDLQDSGIHFMVTCQVF